VESGLSKTQIDLKASTAALHSQVDRIFKLEHDVQALTTECTKATNVNNEQNQSIQFMQSQLQSFGEQFEETSGQLMDLNTKLMTVGTMRAGKPQRDQRVDNLVELMKNFDTEISSQKAAMVGFSAAIEQLTGKLKEVAAREVPDVSIDLIEIRADLKQLWGKIKELTAVQAEPKEDLLPKTLDLAGARRFAMTAAANLEKTALPRIAAPKSPRDDPRVSETAHRVDKQEGLLYQIKRTVDAHEKGLVQLDEVKADRVAAQQLFEQFRIAMGELNSRIGSLRRALVGKLDAADLNAYVTEILNTAGDDTAGGTGQIRCLCCGKPKRAVTGTLEEPGIAQRLPVPTSTRVLGEAGQVCFVYGERGDMYIGRSANGRPMVSKAPDGAEATKK
jgi:chromosome segregation ATPase